MLIDIYWILWNHTECRPESIRYVLKLKGCILEPTRYNRIWSILIEICYIQNIPVDACQNISDIYFESYRHLLKLHRYLLESIEYRIDSGTYLTDSP